MGTRRNPPTATVPSVVSLIADAVRARLGREPYVRQVKNEREWWISDPVFSFIQHGFRKGATGYRVGFFYSEELDLLSFYLVHSPVMARLLKENFSTEVVLDVAKKTAKYRGRSVVFWGSRVARKAGKREAAVEEEKISDFSRELRSWENDVGIKNDLFPSIPNQGKGTGQAKWAGNDFGLLLGEGVSRFDASAIGRLVAGAWPMMLMLYPREALEKRVASLARNLTSAGIPKACEVSCIAGIEKLLGHATACAGRLEGAHIKPHALGGTDLANNGLWLCQRHHRLTEGHLAGTRDRPRVKAQLSSSAT